MPCKLKDFIEKGRSNLISTPNQSTPMSSFVKTHIEKRDHASVATSKPAGIPGQQKS